ncbi:amino acid permease [Bacillus smithii]|jgi:arginine:ornithine antiporter/lysine permease|uniref:amino acid permease n=1 Tax=Bacillus smithii TaxID=1479 RepID=UPI002E1A4693|nr:amino acid permease [Bacillus smithii]MED1488025.1 amino acid permease [Bacillus smithii]
MEQKRLGFWLLTALVVGNMVGSGIFMLPRTLSEAANPAAVLLGWSLTGFGVLTTALVFGNLSIRKPELNGGPQIYAKELFKEGSTLSTLSGFMSSWGYWIGNFAGNVAIITTFTSYLATFFPILNSKAPLFTIGTVAFKTGNVLTFIICTAMLWFTHFLILRGIEGAGKINFLATSAKVIGFFLFIVLSLFAFQKSNLLPFTAPRLDESGHPLGILTQINHAAVSTLWAFVGVESAIVFASRAKKQSDIKRATIIGLMIALAIYIGISLLVMGVLPQETLIHSEKPLVDAIETIIGPIGAYLIAGLGLISLAGSTIGWVLMSAEVPYQAAKQGLFLASFLKENKRGVPSFSLWLSNVLGQLFIFSTISNSMAHAFDFVIYIATLAYLMPYLIASLFQLKLVWTGETYQLNKSRYTDGLIALLSTIYSIWVIYAGTSDLKTFLFGAALLASGLIFYPSLRKQTQATPFTKNGRLLANQEETP